MTRQQFHRNNSLQYKIHVQNASLHVSTALKSIFFASLSLYSNNLISFYMYLLPYSKILYAHEHATDHNEWHLPISQ